MNNKSKKQNKNIHGSDKGELPVNEMQAHKSKAEFQDHLLGELSSKSNEVDEKTTNVHGTSSILNQFQYQIGHPERIKEGRKIIKK